MSRTLATLALLAAFASAQSRPAPRKTAAVSPTDQKIEALLKQMTVEEKVGQMTQVAIDVVTASGVGADHKLDPAKLAQAVVEKKVGSILNVNGQAYPLEHWHEVLNAIQDTVEKTRLKIPVLYGIDSIHGANYVSNAQLLPQAISLASSWNTDLAVRAGEISALQTRAAGIPWNFYPVLDLARQPAWPRFWETYGEDTLMVTEMGKAYIRGMQGDDMAAADKVVACLKHYAGYGFPINGKDRTPAWIPEREMREYFLPMFEAAVKAGVPTVMVNSGEINGIPGHANKWLLTDVLKKEWNFQGLVVSDWEDIKRLHTRDMVAPTPKDAVRLAVNSGLDMSMVPMDFTFYDLLLECAKDGSVPMARIDDAVRRILRVKYMSGIMTNPRPNAKGKELFNDPKLRAANLDLARESLVLLKNENAVLPIPPGKRVLVTGPNADLRNILNGGWSTTWQGDQEQTYPKDTLTVLGGIRKSAGEPFVTYLPGTTHDKNVDIAAAVAQARRSDLVIAVIGEKSYCETPGNIDNLELDEVQLRLVAELAATKVPVVVVYIGGRGRVIHKIVPLVQGILYAGLPGAMGGEAIADVLYGTVNPSGKLPFTWQRAPNSLVWYDYKPIEATADNLLGWEWPFGFGLSFTSFEYSNLTLSSNELARTGKLTVKVTVKNTGRRAGSEAVQLYVSDLYRSITPPNKQLHGFQKVKLQAGSSETVEFALEPSNFRFIGVDNKWTVEPGTFRVAIGGLKKEFTLR